MDIGRDRPACECARVRAAAQRWRSRKAKRESCERALSRRRYAACDEPARLEMRVERLRRWSRAVAELRPDRGAGPADRPIADDGVVSVEEATAAVNDMLSIEFLEIALDAARCVGCVVTVGAANGTGFLVGRDLMLTNHHVLPTARVAIASEMQMGFEDNAFGAVSPSHTFGLDPERFFAADEELDYALVAVRPVSEAGAALEGYGFKPLIGAEGKLAVGEPVNIIQHPRGQPKRIVIRNNQLVDLFLDDPAKPPFFHYTAGTEKGSSGSPVFNDQWEVVALHHQSVPRTDHRGRLVDRNRRLMRANEEGRRADWVANEGIRVSRLVDHLSRREDLPSAMTSTRDELLRLWLDHAEPAAQLRALHERSIDRSSPIALGARPEPHPASVIRPSTFGDTVPPSAVT